MTLSKEQIDSLRAVVLGELANWETGNPTTVELAPTLIRVAVEDSLAFVASFVHVNRTKVLARLAILGVLDIVEKAWKTEVAASN
jgi:hypothetical protein